MKRYIFLFILIFVFALGCSDSPEQLFEQLSREAQDQYENHAYAEAIKKWQAALEIHPSDLQVLSNIGSAYLKLAELHKAREVIQQVAKLSPDNLDAWVEIAKVDILLGEVHSAEKICAVHLKDGSNHARLFVLRGDIAFLKKDYLRSERDYRSALRAAPDSHFSSARLALCLLAKGQVSESRQVIEALLAKQPDNPDVLLQVAAYHAATGDLDRAERGFRSTVASDPGNIAYRLMLAEFYAEHNRVDEALAVLQEIVDRHPNHRSARKRLVDIALLKGDLQRIESLLEGLFEENPESIDILLLKGKYHLMRWEPSLAVVHFKTVTDKEPNFPTAEYLLGLAYFGGGRNQLGFQSITRALTLDTGFTDAELALAGYHYRNREYTVARQYADRVITKEPANFRAYMIRGGIELETKNYDAAVRDFRVASAIKPDSLAADYYRAAALEGSGRYTAAEAILRSIAERCPDCHDANERLLHLLVRFNRHDDAILYFKQQRLRLPENYLSHHCLGEALYGSGDLDAAQKCYQRSIQLNNQSGLDYLRLASIHREMQQIELEISVLKQAVESAPGLESLWLGLADAYRRSGNTDKALQTLERAYGMVAVSAQLQNNIAALMLETGKDLNRALYLASEAYEKASEDPAVSDTLGWAYYQKGIYSQAIWYLQEALEAKCSMLACDKSAPESWDLNAKAEMASVYYRLGKAMQASGDSNEAKEHMEMAASLGYGN